MENKFSTFSTIISLPPSHEPPSTLIAITVVYYIINSGRDLRNIEVSIFFEFYDRKNNSKKLIDEIIFSDITLKKDISFNEMKKILNKKSIKYDLDEEYREDYDFDIKDHKILSIRYIENDLTGPWAVQIATGL